MASPSYWVFRRGQKWHSGWRDERGRCHSKLQPIGAGKDLAREYARRQALEACQVLAGQSVHGKDIRSALEAFLARQDVKTCTHDLNRRHLSALIDHFKLVTVEQLTRDLVDAWLGRLKAAGANPGGQSLSLRILRTFCRFCRKRRWLSSYPFEDFRIPKSEFVGQYLTEEQRDRLLSINPLYDIDRHLHRALTFGLYSLLRISQVFHADWTHFKAPDQLWVPGIKGQQGRWIALHPRALEVIGSPKNAGQIFDRWDSLAAFREAVYKKAKREKLRGVRFHETKHTGISALLEAGYSIPEVCTISGNSPRTIMHYAHVNEQRAFEKWKTFAYAEPQRDTQTRTAHIQQNRTNQSSKTAPASTKEEQGEIQISSISRQVLSA